MRRLGPAILTTSALLFAGCGTMETHVVMFRTPAGGSGEAQLFIETVPSRPFVEVGLLQAIGTGDRASTPTVLSALRAEGTKRGCDAIAMVRANTGNTTAHASGMCVVWTGETPPPPAAP